MPRIRIRIRGVCFRPNLKTEFKIELKDRVERSTNETNSIKDVEGRLL